MLCSPAAVRSREFLPDAGGTVRHRAPDGATDGRACGPREPTSSCSRGPGSTPSSALSRRRNSSYKRSAARASPWPTYPRSRYSQARSRNGASRTQRVQALERIVVVAQLQPQRSEILHGAHPALVEDRAQAADRGRVHVGARGSPPQGECRGELLCSRVHVEPGRRAGTRRTGTRPWSCGAGRARSRAAWSGPRGRRPDRRAPRTRVAAGSRGPGAWSPRCAAARCPTRHRAAVPGSRRRPCARRASRGRRGTPGRRDASAAPRR